MKQPHREIIHIRKEVKRIHYWLVPRMARMAKIEAEIEPWRRSRSCQSPTFLSAQVSTGKFNARFLITLHGIWPGVSAKFKA